MVKKGAGEAATSKGGLLKHSDDKIVEIKLHALRGEGVAEISQALGISSTSVRRFLGFVTVDQRRSAASQRKNKENNERLDKLAQDIFDREQRNGTGPDIKTTTTTRKRGGTSNVSIAPVKKSGASTSNGKGKNEATAVPVQNKKRTRSSAVSVEVPSPKKRKGKEKAIEPEEEEEEAADEQDEEEVQIVEEEEVEEEEVQEAEPEEEETRSESFDQKPSQAGKSPKKKRAARRMVPYVELPSTSFSSSITFGGGGGGGKQKKRRPNGEGSSSGYPSDKVDRYLLPPKFRKDNPDWQPGMPVPAGTDAALLRAIQDHVDRHDQPKELNEPSGSGERKNVAAKEEEVLVVSDDAEGSPETIEDEPSGEGAELGFAESPTTQEAEISPRKNGKQRAISPPTQVQEEIDIRSESSIADEPSTPGASEKGEKEHSNAIEAPLMEATSSVISTRVEEVLDEAAGNTITSPAKDAIAAGLDFTVEEVASPTGDLFSSPAKGRESTAPLIVEAERGSLADAVMGPNPQQEEESVDEDEQSEIDEPASAAIDEVGEATELGAEGAIEPAAETQEETTEVVEEALQEASASVEDGLETPAPAEPELAIEAETSTSSEPAVETPEDPAQPIDNSPVELSDGIEAALTSNAADETRIEEGASAAAASDEAPVVADTVNEIVTKESIDLDVPADVASGSLAVQSSALGVVEDPIAPEDGPEEVPGSPEDDAPMTVDLPSPPAEFDPYEEALFTSGAMEIGAGAPSHALSELEDEATPAELEQSNEEVPIEIDPYTEAEVTAGAMEAGVEAPSQALSTPENEAMPIAQADLDMALSYEEAPIENLSYVEAELLDDTSALAAEPSIQAASEQDVPTAVEQEATPLEETVLVVEQTVEETPIEEDTSPIVDATASEVEQTVAPGIEEPVPSLLETPIDQEGRELVTPEPPAEVVEAIEAQAQATPHKVAVPVDTPEVMAEV